MKHSRQIPGAAKNDSVLRGTAFLKMALLNRNRMRIALRFCTLAVLVAAIATSAVAQMAITSTSPLPQATAGGSYSFQFQAVGGAPPYTWSIVAPLFGPPPAGTSLSSSGLLQGIPQQAGTRTFGVKATDTDGASISKNFSLTVLQGLVIATSSPLPQGVPGQQYQLTLLATGGTAPYNWDLNGGFLPPGYQLDPQKGEIIGITSQQGVFQFQVLVVDSQQRTAIKDFVLSVRAGGLTIAPDPPLPTAFVGQTYSALLTVPGGGQTFFSWRIISGALPPGLDLSIETGEIRGIPSEAGTFVWTVLAQDADGVSAVRQYSILVEGNPQQLPNLEVDRLPLNFSFASGGGPGTRGMRIRNTGGGQIPVTIGESTQTGGNWLSISPQQGVVTAANPLEVLVAADPTKTGPGSFLGNVSVSSDSLLDGLTTAAPQTLGIPASMTISSRRQFLRLSLDGLTFTAVQGVTPVPSLSFYVFNDGVDVMPFTTSAVTVPPGATWLGTTTGQTTVSPAGRQRVSVQVTPQGLSPGVYFGLIEVRASGAAGEVRLLTVVLNLLPPGSQPPPVVEPVGVLFTGTAGGTAAGKTFLIFVQGPGGTTFTSQRFTEGPVDPFTHSPEQGTVAPGQPAIITVQPTIGSLAPGVYRSTIVLTFGDGTSRAISLALIVGPASGATLRTGAALDACPTALNVTIASLSGGFPSYVDAPGFLRVDVADDCGQPLLPGPGRTVRAEIPGQTVFLEHNTSGTWEATLDLNMGGMQTIEVTAQDLSRGIIGHATIADDIQPPLALRPSIDSGGVIHGASFRPPPLAPGSIISIFGENQSASTNPFGDPAPPGVLPLPELLAGTRVRAGGVFLPLFFSFPKQVNAGLPYNLDPNSGPLSVVVFRGSIPSDPEEMPIAVANPGLFTLNSSGLGEGIFQDIAFRLITNSLPPAPNQRTGISAGEPVIIYATGLGPVTNAPTSGQAASADPLSQVIAGMQLTIGGKNAAFDFRGLAPGFVSLYQINALVPDGLPPGNAEVIMTVNGVSSPAGVTLSIE
jgi:uncharacterized protein (TIGR03437 family)